MALLPGDEKISYLYKFRAPSCHTLDIINNQQLRFSFPREFNDPFDCATRITFDGNRADWEKWMDELSLAGDERAKMENYLRSINYDGSAFDRKWGQDDVNSLMVLALSELNDHVLLWSHYAGNHEGICLGFQTRIEGKSLGILFDEPSLTFSVPGVTKGFLPVRKVRYSTTMPDPYNRLKDADGKLMDFTITKHRDWKYEAERRIVLPRSYVNGQFLRYSKPSLKRIIFGSRSTDDYKQKVFDAVDTHFKGLEIEFYQARPINGEYSLSIDRI